MQRPSAFDSARRLSLPVGQSTMSVLDTGPSEQDDADPPLVFLHGNPTSSYLWRGVIDALAPHRRCIALDLIGMGRSGKPDLEYVWSDHRSYLHAALDALDCGPGGMVLATHDWGVSLGLEYARHRPGRVRGIAMMEGHLRPMDSWQDFDEGGRALFQMLRDPVAGRRAIEEENFFLDAVLPGGMLHQLTGEERAAYQKPFPTPDSRHPIWRWVTQIPIAGDPAEVAQVMTDNLDWLAEAAIPALLLHADPGAIIDSAYLTRLRSTAPALEIRAVGPGLHFLPEDQPDAIASAIRGWAPR